jgi:hypothetical protein
MNTPEPKPWPLPAVDMDATWALPVWPLPEPETAEQYQRDAIASANSMMPDDGSRPPRVTTFCKDEE